MAETNEVKERPILFSGPMVRAILNGRKTQTRRIVEPQPPGACVYAINGNKDRAICMADDTVDVPERPWFVPPYVNKAQCYVECPYGKPGDRLWVRETWEPVEFDDYCVGVVYEATPSTEKGLNAIHWYTVGKDEMLKWQLRRRRKFPSMHMPRWASRITLEITDVRVQRLNDIDEEDAIAEGCINTVKMIYDGMGHPVDYTGKFAVDEYDSLWESINGEGSWAENPYVWVVEFNKVDQC